MLDRARVSQFSAICSKQGCPLRPEQQDPLLQSLLEARSRHFWTTALGRRDHPITDYAAFFNETDIEAFFREEEEFDRKFLDDAQDILSPEQLAAFTKFELARRCLRDACGTVCGFRVMAQMPSPYCPRQPSVSATMRAQCS